MSVLWWLAGRASLLLDPDERDVVRGDLAESGESGFEALRGLLGLVARRQAGLWRNWRPWLALAGLAPLGLWLTRQSAGLTHRSAIYLWMYVDNWRMADLESSGYWRLMAQVSTPIVLSGGVLMVWSWAGGMAIGVLSRRLAGFHSLLLCVVLALAETSAGPRGAFGDNAPVFALTFYRWIYPWILQIALVMFPALWGMRLGRLPLPSPAVIR